MNGANPSGRSIMVAHGDAAKQIWPTESRVGTPEILVTWP